MSVDFITNGFWCNSGTTARTVEWSVSGDPGGHVSVWRLQNGGLAVQIGSTVAFSGTIFDSIPASGQYQYWVVAGNSDGVDTVGKTPSSGFFTFTAGGCVA